MPIKCRPKWGRPVERRRPGVSPALTQRFGDERSKAYMPFNRFSAPEMSALPGASSILSVFTTPSSTTIA